MGRGWVHGVRVVAAAKKGKLFTKIAKEISVSVRLGGESPDSNARLRSALIEARKNSMPKDTIDRAIKRGMGGGSEAELEEIQYEGYAPHGVAFIVETLTDNRNRTVQDLRAIVVRKNGNLGEQGSVLWMFDRVGSILAKKKAADLTQAEEAAIEAGAMDIQDIEESDLFHFITEATDLDAVQKKLTEAGWDLDLSLIHI